MEASTVAGSTEVSQAEARAAAAKGEVEEVEAQLVALMAMAAERAAMEKMEVVPWVVKAVATVVAASTVGVAE